MKSTPTLLDSFNPKHNSFGFLRFTLAALVLVSHGLPIGGFPDDDPFILYTRHGTTLGTLSVAGFFALSGFLITRSYLSTDNLWKYMWHRFLRILPAFWVCLIICAFLFAPFLFFIERGVLVGFFATEDSPVRYITVNFFLLMRQWSISGTPAPGYHIFNGSLWSLIHEFICYLGIGAYGVFGILRRQRWIVLVITIVIWTLQFLCIHAPNSVAMITNHTFIVTFLRYSPFFFAGSVFYLFREKIPYSGKLCLLLLTIYIVGSGYGFFQKDITYTRELEALTLPYIMIWLALRLPFQNFDKRGDFSYGFYIYAFPLQNIMTALGVNHWGFTLYTIVCFIATLVFAIPSYFWIEKPMLDLKHYYGMAAVRKLFRISPK
ncbi:MAG: acyltransferase [Ignavibacteriae bacterium]|nr:acyltransferase [Ignavibacteriota bacterium]